MFRVWLGAVSLFRGTEMECLKFLLARCDRGCGAIADLVSQGYRIASENSA
jgi:hypothetical protein